MKRPYICRREVCAWSTHLKIAVKRQIESFVTVLHDDYVHRLYDLS